MALKKCSECGKEISTQAGKCPGCGKPQTKHSTKVWLGIIVGFFAIAFIIPAMFRDDTQIKSSLPPSSPPIQKRQPIVKPQSEAQKKHNAIIARKSYVSQVERLFASKGIIIYSEIKGKNSDILRLEFMGASNQKFKFTEIFTNEKINDALKSVGFKDVKIAGILD